MKSASMCLTKLLALIFFITVTGGLYAQQGDSGVFRKNISKTATLASNKAKMNIMPVYVPLLNAQGDPIPLEEQDKTSPTPDTGKPIVVSYVDVVEGAGGASDVWVAVSRDDGATWKRKNVSRTADDSSFGSYNGDSRKPMLQVQGNYMLVAWTDKFCKGGSPRYSLEDGDTHGVGGSQGSIDYDQVKDTEGMGIGVVPFSCVWTVRGLIVTEKEANDISGPFFGYEVGEIVWYKPERVTSARRDAYQLFMSGKAKAGFAIAWQEDPEGLRPGSADGPGSGWSGATTNHKTDIWYSYLKWADFLEVEAFEDVLYPDDEDLTKPRAANRMSLPLRITDNQSCKREHVEAIDGTSNQHAYCASVCANYVNITSSGGQTADVCVTADGRLLDGDTGASRPNLFLQSKSGGAWAILAYEETKGLGSGNSDSHDHDAPILDGEDKVDPEDLGKDIFYHTFDFT